MGLFDIYNIKKPGKGIEKDTEPMSPIKQFFVVLGRRFIKLLCLNFLYLTFAVPTTLLIIFLFSPIVVSLNLDMSFANVYFTGIALFLATVGFAPFNAPMAYILRNYAKREHAWVVQDFFQQLKLNFKKSIIVMIIDLLVIAVFAIDFLFMDKVIDNVYMLTFTKMIVLIVSFLFVVMHFYLYQFIVTFDMKLSEMYKNSMILAFAKLPMNVLLCAIIFVLGMLFILFPYMNVVFVVFVAYVPTYYAQHVVSGLIQKETEY